MKKVVYIFIVASLFLWGCTTTQKGAAVGGVAGAGLGAIIGHQSGHGVEGAGIGAAVGAISGALVGEKLETKYCPVCGKRYTSGVKYCTEDGTELKDIKK
ncbi:MAG: YMGG-like glycine zipper-containing protein [Candidatus Omnitrophota bacterium]